ncbi:hypothetical protein [Pseudomonas huaxiensis]|uniref:hypothetical protein n=1 Tax=Pseudomonas huaxiensis TaxID=2213017 RepID=UPI000DA6489F|nr:hypothetical protein [Pseudomonas huaxiensis]
MKMELALYQALTAINVPELKITAVIEALEADLLSLLATKADVAALRTEVKTDLAQMETKLTIRMGMMFSATIGILLTAMKVLL